MGYIATDIKGRNRQDVYRIFETNAEVSRADLSRMTGISGPTVLKIVSYFSEFGLIEEIGTVQSSIGRRPQMLRLIPNAFYSIGVNYEGDYLSLGLVDLCGTVSNIMQTAADGNYQNVICNQLPNLVYEYLSDNAIPKEKILGVGIGIPAIVDPDKHTLRHAPAIGIGDAVDYSGIKGDLSRKVGLPVFMENDANAAAIGEHFSRRHSGVKDLAYVSLGTGLGAGLVLENTLRRGRWNYCGEIGYMTYVSNALASTDKPGWLESRLNIASLRAKSSIFEKLLCGSPWEKYAHDPAYCSLVDYVAEELAICLSSMSCILDLEELVIGGMTVKLLGTPLLEQVNLNLSQISARPTKCSSQQCEDSTVAGSAVISSRVELQKRFAD